MYGGEKFQADGEIRLLSAHISGQLDLRGAKLANPGGNALSADRITVDGSVYCGEGFKAKGEIRLPGAHISGQLDLTKAKLVNPGGNALSADRIAVSSMFGRNGFQADGEIVLPGAHISGQLDLRGAELANPGRNALSADRITVDGDMYCGEGFKAKGEIRLPGAHISGRLDLTGGKLANPGGTAFNADRAVWGFQAGSRGLDAHISGRLDLRGQAGQPRRDRVKRDHRRRQRVLRGGVPGQRRDPAPGRAHQRAAQILGCFTPRQTDAGLAASRVAVAGLHGGHRFSTPGLRAG